MPRHFASASMSLSHLPEKASTEQAFSAVSPTIGASGYGSTVRHRIAQVVGRNILLLEGGEIRRPFCIAEVYHHGPILPHIVVVSGIVTGAVDEALGRSLVHVRVVETIAFGVEPAEDIDVGLLAFCAIEHPQQGCGRFGMSGPVHDVAQSPGAGL